jgi:hypothetical protein
MDRDCGIRMAVGAELERVQVCRYRAPRCRGFARPTLRRSATGRGFSWILESPPLMLAFTSAGMYAVTGAEGREHVLAGRRWAGQPSRLQAKSPSRNGP